ncbi:MAG: CPBP family intramembrane metalloprotease [Flavobacteriaceae bacterium]|nr:CPBP family intramembrane metalloprotease [Bacteroidia bacterium]NND09852.1 CPBP family intramembrane metalloprotease [Flavobacteriaceae bacterium]NNK27698.1 CPBP family intramembrane metalloprotease [Flavobacteriaceae bacterium]NNL60736.1 CPBP family intramembrane metalloprotease [Flavobacteriaceae bacterium]RZV66536.1 MAG: CPBP family intramembrane metalloprotease [Flavobacteriaceae bacterium]
MYIAQTYNVLHEWWRYVLGVIIAVIGVFVFSVPHIIAIFAKRMKAEVDLTRLEDVNYIMGLFDPNINLIYILLPFAGGLIFLFIAVKLLHRQSLRHLTTARKKVDWKRIWFAFFLWGILSSSLVIVDYFMAPEDFVMNFEWQRFAVLALIAVILIPLQTSFEEYLFRGYLMQGIGALVKNRWFPLLLTSVVFGMLHIANPEVEKLGNTIMIYYIGTGLFLGILTLMDDGLELALGFHAANNLFTALLVTANWTAFQTHSVFKDVSEPSLGFIDMILPIFIIFPILLFIFAKKYNWTDWQGKLLGRVEQPKLEDYKVIEDTNDTSL